MIRVICFRRVFKATYLNKYSRHDHNNCHYDTLTHNTQNAELNATPVPCARLKCDAFISIVAKYNLKASHSQQLPSYKCHLPNNLQQLDQKARRQQQSHNKQDDRRAVQTNSHLTLILLRNCWWKVANLTLFRHRGSIQTVSNPQSHPQLLL